ncbi:hypothetical protein BO78DRAFT_125437 [Aspergillus sclerotiicarbonarius CBS 121057]|uniref:Uncharacterized protein n=1 Tax=Aspergillus sclerotiicarbonarius (strain CBS 121057 / IBT 28362) TaxID=1448318 RepID=A0A319E7Q0_ASPSB|nr:hypothetical protein BO78DRAFT_125437 [Aspergillus sclerotiicarbonarius CBS 121057]
MGSDPFFFSLFLASPGESVGTKPTQSGLAAYLLPASLCLTRRTGSRRWQSALLDCWTAVLGRPDRLEHQVGIDAGITQGKGIYRFSHFVGEPGIQRLRQGHGRRS